MDFLDNMVKSSNALIKDKLNNPFGVRQQTKSSQQSNEEPSQETAEISTGSRDQQDSAPTSRLIQENPSDQPASQSKDDSIDSDKTNSQFAAIAADAEAVTQKAVAGAKNIGNFLFSMANKAGQTVSQTAKQVKQAVENTNILTDFTREQQEFIKQHGSNIQAGELPWTCYKDEAKANEMREQILTLSQDKRNFVRSPPNDSNFQFDAQQCYPVALSLLKEDPNLCNMRFELVPKFVNEDAFWCNYFYRVSLLKRFIDEGGDVAKKGWASSRSSSGEGPDEVTNIEEINQSDGATFGNKVPKNETSPSLQQRDRSSSPDQALESDESRKLFAEADDLKNKLKELNIGSLDNDGSQDDNNKWEEELQRDLQEFEVVPNDLSALEEEELQKDIMELKNGVSK